PAASPAAIVGLGKLNRQAPLARLISLIPPVHLDLLSEWCVIREVLPRGTESRVSISITDEERCATERGWLQRVRRLHRASREPLPWPSHCIGIFVDPGARTPELQRDGPGGPRTAARVEDRVPRPGEQLDEIGHSVLALLPLVQILLPALARDDIRTDL